MHINSTRMFLVGTPIKSITCRPCFMKHHRSTRIFLVGTLIKSLPCMECFIKHHHSTRIFLVGTLIKSLLCGPCYQATSFIQNMCTWVQNNPQFPNGIDTNNMFYETACPVTGGEEDGPTNSYACYNC